MEQFISQIPSTPLGWIALIIVVTASFIYLISQVRRSDMKILRDANQDLRERLDDKGKEIKELQDNFKILEAKVDVLEKRNRTLEDLMVTALKQYFYEHPDIAKTMQKAIIGV